MSSARSSNSPSLEQLYAPLVSPLSISKRQKLQSSVEVVISRESYQSADEKVASVLLCTLKRVLIKSHQRCCFAISGYSFYQ